MIEHLNVSDGLEVLDHRSRPLILIVCAEDDPHILVLSHSSGLQQLPTRPEARLARTATTRL